MARLHSSLGDRTTYTPQGVAKADGTKVQVFEDEQCTVPANLAAYNPANPGAPGTPVPGAELTVDAWSNRPKFWDLNDRDYLWVVAGNGPAERIQPDHQPQITALTGRVTSVEGVAGAALPRAGGTVTGSLSLSSSFAGGEDDGQPGQFDSTSRLNLYSYQRADVGSYGETIRHYAMRKDSKQMEAWYFPAGGYDANRNPVGLMKPVVWAGAHWEANNHASNHKHWSVETPDATGAIQTRFEVRWGDPTNDAAIAGLDKTLVMTNLADLVVRCSNNQVLRLSGAAAGSNKAIEFNHDYEGSTQYRRWQIRATNEAESGAGAGTNFQLARYDDTGTLVDTPIVVSRATGNITLGPGMVARRSSSTVSSLSLNTSSLGGGVGVLALGNASTPPGSNPTGGVVLYAANGRLKIRQPDGTDQFVALTPT